MRPKHSALSRGEGREGLKDIVVLLSAEAGAASSEQHCHRRSLGHHICHFQGVTSIQNGRRKIRHTGSAVEGSMCVKLFLGKYGAEVANAGGFVPL
jgi:hypothetical protein